MGFWSNPTLLIDGLTQETCRDNGHHTQFGMGSAIHAAEVAFHQGVDIYTETAPRFSAALELMATQLLTNSMQGTCTNNTATGDLYDTWEIGYNHYHNRKGVALPKTDELIRTKIRPKARMADWNLICETMTHADVDLQTVSVGSTIRPNKKIADVFLLKNARCEILSPVDGTFEVTTFTLNGKEIGKTTVAVQANERQSIQVNAKPASAGCYLFRVKMADTDFYFRNNLIDMQ
jgi:hypothetical protein